MMGLGHMVEDVDRDVREALAVALNEKKMRVVTRAQRRRSLVIYCLLIVLLAAIGTIAVRTRDALRAECIDTRTNTQIINTFVNRLILSYQHSPVLSPSERAQRVAMLAPLHQSVPTCPPSGWW